MINIVEPVRSILGPATPEPEVQRRAAELWECLELAVGTRLGSRLTDHEMIEFERLRFPTGTAVAAVLALARDRAAGRVEVVAAREGLEVGLGG